MAAGTSDNRIEIRDLSSGAIREEIPLKFVPSEISVSADRKLIGVVATPPASRLYVIPLDGKHEPRELREMTAQSHIFTPDARLLVATLLQRCAAWSAHRFLRESEHSKPTRRSIVALAAGAAPDWL